jgi:hypothetical protein
MSSGCCVNEAAAQVLETFPRTILRGFANAPPIARCDITGTGRLCGRGADRRGIRFWNLTLYTITNFQMSPAGQDSWGPDQCQNDRDGTVDHDER